jgi:hypothetical protein
VIIIIAITKIEYESAYKMTQTYLHSIIEFEIARYISDKYTFVQNHHMFDLDLIK